MKTNVQKKAARATRTGGRGRAIDALVEALDSRFFRALAEPVRVEILKVLLARGRSDIGAVTEEVGKDRSVVSRHLHLLAHAGLVRSEKVARSVYFEIDPDGFRARARAFFEQVERATRECCG